MPVLMVPKDKEFEKKAIYSMLWDECPVEMRWHIAKEVAKLGMDPEKCKEKVEQINDAMKQIVKNGGGKALEAFGEARYVSIPVADKLYPKHPTRYGVKLTSGRAAELLVKFTGDIVKLSQVAKESTKFALDDISQDDAIDVFNKNRDRVIELAKDVGTSSLFYLRVGRIAELFSQYPDRFMEYGREYGYGGLNALQNNSDQYRAVLKYCKGNMTLDELGMALKHLGESKPGGANRPMKA